MSPLATVFLGAILDVLVFVVFLAPPCLTLAGVVSPPSLMVRGSPPSLADGSSPCLAGGGTTWEVLVFVVFLGGLEPFCEGRFVPVVFLTVFLTVFFGSTFLAMA